MNKFNNIFYSPDDGTGSATGGGTPSAPASGGTPPGATSENPPSSGSDPAKFPSVKLGGANGQSDPKLGADGKPLPAENGAAAPASEYFGAPEGDKDYGDLTLPEGQELDADLVKDMKPVLKEMGISQKGFQKLADTFMEKYVNKQNAAFVEQVSQWEKDTRADKEIGGEKFEASVAAGIKALGAFGTPELSKLLTSYGLGNNPEIVRFMSRVGNAIVGEDNAGGKPAGSNSQQKDARDLFYGPAKS